MDKNIETRTKALRDEMTADAIHSDEEQFLVKSLLTQTQKGKIVWECEEYLPASFMLGDKESDSKDYIMHMVTFIYETKDRRYVLDISESIETETGIVCVHPILYVYDDQDNLMEQIEDVIDEPKKMEDKYGFLPLCDLMFVKADDWLDDYYFDRYGNTLPFYMQKGITKKHREQPLCRLMERLMNKRQVKDFHKMIMDAPFREQLLSGNTK
jgi:hypothetical protein